MYVEVVEEAVPTNNPFSYMKGKYSGLKKWWKLKDRNGKLSLQAYLSQDKAENALKEHLLSRSI